MASISLAGRLRTFSTSINESRDLMPLDLAAVAARAWGVGGGGGGAVVEGLGGSGVRGVVAFWRRSSIFSL